MKFVKTIIIVLIGVAFSQISYGQSHAQRAAMTHARMTQQMNHNFHMMYLNMINNSSSRSVKKNERYIEKRLKHNDKTVTKYTKKLKQLEQKLEGTDANDAKKQKRLKKWIGAYRNAIETINKETYELKPLLQKQKELIAEKKVEKLAKKQARKEKRK